MITSGPYRFVRHPGYTAATTMFVGIPLALASWWALLPAALAIALLVVRTSWEDRLLQANYAAMPTMRAERVVGSCPASGDPADDDRALCTRRHKRHARSLAQQEGVMAMASLRKEIETDARPEYVWVAIRDIGALHPRLVPGFVIATREPVVPMQPRYCHVA